MPERRPRSAPDFTAYVNALIQEGRANGYSFVIHRDRQIITVSRNRKLLTVFGYSWPGVEWKRHEDGCAPCVGCHDGLSCREERRKSMDGDKVARRSLVLHDGELWFGAKVVAVRPTPVPAVVLICTDEPADTAYDATHYVGSTEHYISSRELLEVATNGRGLTADQAGALLAGLIGTRQALATVLQAFDQAQAAPNLLRGTDEWRAALTHARYLLGVSRIVPSGIVV